MKILQIAIIPIFLLFQLTCTAQKIKKNEFIHVEYKTISKGQNSPINDLLIICFNKYFNEESLTSEFLEENNLNEVSYRKKC
jgi:hypothetical protein